MTRRGFLGTGAATALASRDVAIERVFGPEIPTGPYKHPVSISELASGDLYLVYYGGQGEYATRTAVFGSRRKKGETTWSAPVPIARNPLWSVGNGVIWQAPDGLVWLFFVTRFGDTWSDSRIAVKISQDGARTWSDASILTFDAGTMVRNRPIVLRDGDYLLPIYHETGHDPEFLAADSMSSFLRYSRKTGKWKETGRIRSRIGNIQPAPAQISDQELIAYCRRGGGYGPTRDGYLVRAESHDGGWTWSEGRDSRFPNPNAAVDFLRLRNGHLLLVYNDSMSDRTPLTVAISTDGDKSYPYKRNIAVGNYDYAYPTAIQTSDGKVHIVYTSHARTVINHAEFEESAILR